MVTRLLLLLALFTTAAGAQITTSVAFEPTLTAPHALEYDAALSLGVSRAYSVGIQYGYSSTVRPTREWLVGGARTWGPFFALSQSGVICDGAGVHPIILFGAGFSTGPISYAIDFNKQLGAAPWPSLVISYNKVWKIRK